MATTKRRALRNRKAVATSVVSRGSLVLLALMMPLVGVADEPTETKEVADATNQEQVSRLRGYVRDPSDAPIANARVRIAIPKRDMRFSAKEVKSGVFSRLTKLLVEDEKEYSAKTDESGLYMIEIPDVSRPIVASIDAAAPGFERLSGTLMRGGDARTVKLVPKSIARENLVLNPAAYFRGVVVDQDSKPIADVEVSANMQLGRGSGGVERTSTDQNGEFELFNYPLEPEKGNRGWVGFSHPEFLRQMINDIYEGEADEREKLRVVLDKGRVVAGRLIDASGKPAVDKMVKAVGAKGAGRKAVMTNSDGEFSLKGLPKGKITLTSLDFVGGEKTEHSIEDEADSSNVELRLEKITLPDQIPTHNVLGMKMTDVTVELKDAYNLWSDVGALILDPGKDPHRLKIGKLEPGFDFWMVGRQRIVGVRDFVEQIIAESENQDGPLFMIRVVYNMRVLKFDGTNTQYLRLTKTDIDGLRKLLDALPEAEPLAELDSDDSKE